MDTAHLAELRRLIDTEPAFVHVTHVNPDADGLGSALAMHRYLRWLGKESRVLVPSPLSSRLGFLTEPGEVEVFEPEEPPDRAAVFVYDVSHFDRLGELAALARGPGRSLAVFDHHDADVEVSGVALVDPEAGATAQIIAELLIAWGVSLDLDLAFPLYVGLVSDTGSFNYGKTTPRTHEVAARLLEAGVDPLAVHGLLEGRRSLASLRLTGRVLANLVRDEAEPRIAHVTLDAGVLGDVPPEDLDTGQLVNHAISLDGVLAGILFHEAEPGRTRLSLRSKGGTSVLSTARAFGGGGHRNAAGAMVEADVRGARKKVLARLRAELASQHGPPTHGR